MDAVLQTAISNALSASILAGLTLLIGCFYRRPAAVHVLWVLVLVRLLAPPLGCVSISLMRLPRLSDVENTLARAIEPADWTSSQKRLAPWTASDHAPTQSRQAADGTKVPSYAASDHEVDGMNWLGAPERLFTTEFLLALADEFFINGGGQMPIDPLKVHRLSELIRLKAEDSPRSLSVVVVGEKADRADRANRADSPFITAPAVSSSPKIERGAPSPTWFDPLLQWTSTALILIWLGGSICISLRAATRWGRFGLLFDSAQLAPNDIQQLAYRLARQLELKLSAVPTVWVAPAPIPPMVLSWGAAPRLVLPLGLWGRLSAHQRETLLLHEMAHLKRRDHWVRLLELLASCVFWWHPVLWLARRRIHQTEEQCCDALVIQQAPAARQDYALALMAVIDFLARPSIAITRAGPQLPPSACGVGEVEFLRRRITAIMRQQTTVALSKPPIRLFIVWGIISLVFLPKFVDPDQLAVPKSVKSGSVRISGKLVESIPR